jgi:hypothetical protein
MIRRLSSSCAAVSLSVLGAQETFDRAMVAKIRDEGMNHHSVWGMVDTLATVIGPRLTATPRICGGGDVARDHLTAWGLKDVHFETWPFGRGWEMQKFTLEMTAPRYAPMIGYPDAWSASTKGTSLERRCSRRTATTRSKKMRGKLKGAIVMTQPMMTTFIREDRINRRLDAPPNAPAAGRRRGGRGPDGWTDRSGASPRCCTTPAWAQCSSQAAESTEPSFSKHATREPTPSRPSSSRASITITSFAFSKIVFP